MQKPILALYSDGTDGNKLSKNALSVSEGEKLIVNHKEV